MNSRPQLTRPSLLADVRSVLASQSSIVATSSGLEKTIRDQLSSVSNLIKEQEESLTSKLHDKGEECQELAARLAEKSSQLQTAATNVQQISQVADEKSGLVKDLHSRIGELQAIAQEKHELELKNKILVERLSNKDSDNASLQVQLEDAIGQNNARALELQNLARQIADHLQEKGADAADVSSLRAKMSCKLELEKSKLDESKRALQRQEEERSKLEKELACIASEKSRFSKELEELRTLRADEAASLERTRISLTHAEQRIINLKDRLKRSEFKTRDIQNALTQWAGKKSNGAGLPEGLLDLDLDAMRVLVKSIMDTHRESEAAKDCLRAVLEIPSPATSDDLDLVEKPSCSPALGQQGRSIEASEPTPVASTVGIIEGASVGVAPMGKGGDSVTAGHAPVTMDTSKDSVRRIIVQSPFEEGKGPLPPSVEQERTSRRRYTQPLSILKSASGGPPETISPTHVSPRSQRTSAHVPALGGRTKSFSSTHRDSLISATNDVENREVDARTAGFLGKIKQSLGLQRSVSSDSGRKRKGATGEEENPSKAAKTWQSMFGTLDLEMGDLKSSCFSAPVQPQRLTEAASEKRSAMLAPPNVKNGPRTNPSTRAKPPGQQGRQGKARGVVRTYSKKPREPDKE